MFVSVGQLAAGIFGTVISILAFNTWVPLDATFDYVVIGGGTSGVTVGARLAQNGFRVALVEAGGYYELRHPIARIPGGIGANPKSHTPIDWKFVAHSVPGAGSRDIHYPRGKCLGGSSAVNFLIYRLPSKDAMRMWADLVNDTSYLFENCFPLYKKTVTFTSPEGRPGSVPSYKESAFSSTSEPLHVSYPKHPMDFSSWAQRDFTEVGLPEAEDFNSGSIMGHQFCAMTIRPRDQTRSTSESAFMGGFKQLNNLTVYQKTLAKKILFDSKGRAVGVRVKHKWSYTLRAAKEVILSAGAFQSPQLLMVSGIGPADTLRKHGIKVIADRPGVGQNMWDHVFFGPSYPVAVNTFTDMAQYLDHLLLQALKWLIFSKGILSNPSTDYIGFEKLPSLFRSMFSAEDEQALAWFPTDWPEVEYLVASAYVGNFSDPFWQQPIFGQYGSIVASIVSPTSRGNVTIRSANMADPPIINPNWLATETDQRVAVAAYKRIRDIFNTTAMEQFLWGQSTSQDSRYRPTMKYLL